MPRKFRFGLRDSGDPLQVQQWRDLVRKAEDLGFSTFVVQDHFDHQFAPLTALTLAAELTSSIRLASIVLDNDFRHPATLAKEAATLDVFSGGRIELGLGAGWRSADYEASGLQFRSPRERYERLTETVHICKTFFSGQPVTFEGQHFRVDHLEASPKVLQQPRPPILVGARKKRLISFAAREADIVSISVLHEDTPGLPPPPSFTEKAQWVRQAAGERIGELEIQVNVSNLVITDNLQEGLDQVATRLGIPPNAVLDSPANLVGSVAAIVDQIDGWREKCGVSYFVIGRRLIDSASRLVARAGGR
ncbi:MAG: TIGR03621 family F420-dependent LLM class oxidoreductase [Chloroflexi bacterium]|nr:TIGR03621 family F420-dependent LLM class oxidoreductase [Chloroflexota bacterium]